ncbi:uncharacterized protein LOC126885273 isoform X2 [Diabrotica virgifera virgifera]|uniref:Peptidoglycan recognition protein family domain-containing protein n=1 Tax=Diabrotica virgifera virgifera TaxID=50390 RepID=A0ABM5KBZ5_DIAVI|nr:uncharacterized protein LOC126885273 isoform X2 [Diabrotica virgifera virgifera]
MDNPNDNAASEPSLEDKSSAPGEDEKKNESTSNTLENINLTTHEEDDPETDDDDPLKEGETAPLLAPNEDSKESKPDTPASKPLALNLDNPGNQQIGTELVTKSDNTMSKPSNDNPFNKPLIDDPAIKPPTDNPLNKPLNGDPASKSLNDNPLNKPFIGDPPSKSPTAPNLENPGNQQNGTGFVSKLKSVAENFLSSSDSSRPTEYDPESLDNEESTPLLSGIPLNRRFLDRLWLVLFIILIVLAVSIGAFLLIWLGQTQSESGFFNYILKNQWITLEAGYESPNHMRKLKLPARSVFLIELNSMDKTVCREAESYENCVELLRKNQMKYGHEPDILYNFIVDQDGSIYEGRSWERCSCKGSFTDEDITIAFLIDHNFIIEAVPRYVFNFLNQATVDQKLDPCYKTFVYNGTILYVVSDYIKSHRNIC